MTADNRTFNPRLTMAVLSLGAISYAVLSSIVVPALPTIQHDLHTSETGVTWVLTAYLLAAAVGTSILGRLGDIHGKERVLVLALAILTVGTLICALSESLGVLIVGRALQGAAGGIFPLAFGIVRDEFPRERVAGSIGMLSAILGVGGGFAIVASGLILEYLDWHWLFWIPLVMTAGATFFTWRFIPESPVRAPGTINWRAATLMAIGISIVLLAVSQTTTWGWGSPKTLGLLAAGFAVCACWVAVEVRSSDPLVDMTMMRVRGVWTANLSAFLLGAGMYCAFILFPQYAQLPKSTGFGFGASVVGGSLFLLPMTIGMMLTSLMSGRIAHRFGSRAALIAGSALTGMGFAVIVAAHGHTYDFLVVALLVGAGIGLAFSALGNLIVGAVPPEQTGIASGMNTVVRTIGGALGAQLAATFVAGHTIAGHPAVTGFVESFTMATGFLVVGTVAAVLVPRRARAADLGVADESDAVAIAA